MAYSLPLKPPAQSAAAKSVPDTERWLITPDMWSVADHRQATREGWYINCSPDAGMTRICACDVPVGTDEAWAQGHGWSLPTAQPSLMVGVSVRYDPRDPEWSAFVTDTQAAEWVVEKMHQGSAFHERAWRAVVKAQMQGALE